MRRRFRKSKPTSVGIVPGQKLTYEQVAETMRFSVGALATEVYDNVKEGDIDHIEAMVAIAAGALAWGVDAYFRYWMATGMDPKEVRRHLRRDVIFTYQQARDNYAKRKLAEAQAKGTTQQ